MDFKCYKSFMLNKIINFSCISMCPLYINNKSLHVNVGKDRD